jgi:signal transduction histidine kinase
VLERRIGRMDPPPAQGVREPLELIREEIKRLDGLVGDFLQFSKVNRVPQQSTDLDALIDEIVRLLRPAASSTAVTLRHQRVGQAITDVSIDAERMKQVVINLVQNAIEAMPEGGAVTIESGVVDGRAQVVVEDSGPGLPDGLDIFQLFVTTKARGTGLGLSIAQQIVLEHGGEISARNEPGQGARFVISLPLTPAEQGREGMRP